MPRTNAHSLIDWAIATGRSPLDSRAEFVARFALDPVAATAELLTTQPTRPERPCPLFAVDSRRSADAKRSHDTRQRRAAVTVAQTSRLLEGVLSGLGRDHDEPEVRAAVASAVRDLQAADRAARREARREADREARRLGRLTYGQQIAERWADLPPDEPEPEPTPSDSELRQEFVDSLRGQLSQSAQARRAREAARAAQAAAEADYAREAAAVLDRALAPTP